MAQKLAGHSAVVWPPQILRQAEPHLAQALLAELVHRLAQSGVHLAQALLDQPQAAEASLLQESGFLDAGTLLYLAAEAAHFPAESPDLPFSLEMWSPMRAERLDRIVGQTYHGSLDCPLVDGLRQIPDVLAGYREVGQFRPEWWLIVRDHERDAGCLLLADHPEQNQSEIVYMGLVPSARGRGWGERLTRHAQWLARQAKRERVVLAVDAANRPAIAAYRACGFASWDQRRVFFKSLRRR
jgi:ribosomal protein S18 acetylase RimI-like enzyme